MFDCCKKHYQDLVKSKGIDAAFEDLKARYDKDPYVMSQCHPLTHAIGYQAASLFSTVSEAYLHGDSYCWSGYYHGILEGAIARIGAKDLPSKLESICADMPDRPRYGFNYYNCVHGLGHGIMELESDEVFVSLKMCDYLSGSYERQSCWSGVFMENIIAYNRDGFSQYLKKDKPLYPCTDVGDEYKGQCYLGQTSYALQENGYNFSKIFPLCATLDQPYRDICNQSAGRDAAGSTNDDPARTKMNCDFAKDSSDRKNCIVGAVKDLISYFHGVKQATVYCDLYDGEYKSTCHTTADAYFAAL